MINIGNKEITSIYSGKNAVNGIYCGQKLIWPTTPPTPPIEKVYSNMLYVEDADYEYNPSEKTYDSPTTYKTVGRDFYKRRLIVEDTDAEWKRVIGEVIDCEIIQQYGRFYVINRGMSKEPFGQNFRIYDTLFSSEQFDTYEEAESLLEEITRTGSIGWISYTNYDQEHYWTIEAEMTEDIFCGRDGQHMKIFKNQIYPQWSAPATYKYIYRYAFDEDSGDKTTTFDPTNTDDTANMFQDQMIRCYFNGKVYYCTTTETNTNNLYMRALNSGAKMWIVNVDDNKEYTLFKETSSKEEAEEFIQQTTDALVDMPLAEIDLNGFGFELVNENSWDIVEFITPTDWLFEQAEGWYDKAMYSDVDIIL